MNILILKTDISDQHKVKAVSSLFDNIPDIYEWSVDTEDVDNVLRIEASHYLNEEDIIALVRSQGFQCEDLPDLVPD